MKRRLWEFLLTNSSVDIVLYPLTLNRTMNQAAVQALALLRKDGHQSGLVARMQTREELYDVLGYHEYERKLDELFGKAGGEDAPGAKPGKPLGKRGKRGTRGKG